MSTKLTRRVVSKTANYAITPPQDSAGTIFTNRGASAPVTFTLPKPNLGLVGTWYRFKALAGFNVLVAAPTAGTLLTFNNAAATSLALQTAGQLIGGEIEAVCVLTGANPGTPQWAASGVTVAHTFTVA